MLTTLMSFVLAKLGQLLKWRSSGGGGGGDQSYKLLNLGLTALGASALMDNVVLHIVPEVGLGTMWDMVMLMYMYMYIHIC